MNYSKHRTVHAKANEWIHVKRPGFPNGNFDWGRMALYVVGGIIAYYVLVALLPYLLFFGLLIVFGKVFLK